MANPLSWEWWQEHYKDVRGNLKTTLLYTVVGGLVTAFHFLVAGMQWWRHALVDFLFAFISIWLGASLWSVKSATLQSTTALSNLSAPIEQLSSHNPENDAAYIVAQTEHARLLGVGNRIDGAFNSLQIDGIALATFLERFISSANETKMSEDPRTWTIKLIAAYEADCAPQVNRFVSRLERETGRLNGRLRNYKDHIYDIDNIETVRSQIWLEVIRMLNIDFTGEL